MQSCISQIVHNGEETLFWQDRWINSRAIMCLWPNLFRNCQNHKTMLKESVHLLDEAPFSVCIETRPIRDLLFSVDVGNKDKKWWSLTSNGVFLVKSFYNFLNDRGFRCPIARWF